MIFDVQGRDGSRAETVDMQSDPALSLPSPPSPSKAVKLTICGLKVSGHKPRRGIVGQTDYWAQLVNGPVKAG